MRSVANFRAQDSYAKSPVRRVALRRAQDDAIFGVEAVRAAKK
jgi:hypothetical protein